MKFTFSKRFQKRYRKAPQKIREAFQERIILFQKNRFDPLLNNHPLKGELFGKRSINISGDWRAWFTENNDEVFFHIIGTHAQLYR